MRKKFILDKFILELKNFRTGTAFLSSVSCQQLYGWKYLNYSCPFHAFIVGIPETNTKTKQSISQELCICLLKRKTIPYAVLQTKHSWKNPKCTIQ